MNEKEPCREHALDECSAEISVERSIDYIGVEGSADGADGAGSGLGFEEH
jgi:hypothetical protein